MNAFAALADDTRRQIVELVAAKGEIPVAVICRHFEISGPAVSQHLKVLRQAKVLRMKKAAQRRLYSVDEAGIAEVGDWLEEVRKSWNARLDSLDAYLQKLKKEERQ